MATTPNYALPYPIESDPVSAGAAAIQALAERLDATTLPGLVSDAELASTLAGYATDAELAAAIAGAIAKTLVDAKGDLIVATAADAVARLAAGADGQVLTVDAASAAGLKWATPASGGGGAPTMIRGRVSNTGSILGGTGFTVSRAGTGDYTVTFTAAFPAVPVVLLAPVNPSTTAQEAMRVHTVSASSARIIIYNASNGALNIDIGFHFLAVAV